MIKKITCFILLLFMIGCSQKFESKDMLISLDSPKFSTVDKKDNVATTYEEVKAILDPLIEGLILEKDMLLGATYQEGMTLDELQQFLLKYYTQELANETCDLIVYKSELKPGGNGNDGYYSYDRDSNVFYLSVDNPWWMGIIDTVVANIKEGNYEIYSIVEVTEDRIELFLIVNSIDLKDEERVYRVILEKEFNQWYFGDLIFSREIINRANQVYY